MKVEIRSKKGLKTVLSIVVDKKTIQQKLDEKINQLQGKISLKGFRPGKVPYEVIKSQFGKAAYGEVIDLVLKETSSKAIADKKLKIAGQPRIDLKTFGEGKDLNYELQIDTLPDIKLKNLNNFKATQYNIDVEKKIIEDKVNELSKQNKNFKDKKDNEKAEKNDQVIFNYSATVDGNKFDGSEGKDVKIELGKDLFLKGFDNQLIGVKKGDKKMVNAILPPNHPKKELANKKANFTCEIINVKHPTKNIIDDKFAKMLGAKDLNDLKKLISKQISLQYEQALNSITKKEILDQLTFSHNVDIPVNLVEQEVAMMTQNLKKEEILKHKNDNEKLAKARIKIGLILNSYGEENNLKVTDDDIKSEIQKQVKSMPGQEKMVVDYYQKNPNAAQSLRGALYEDKLISLIKSKIKLTSKKITTVEAEKIIKQFNSSESKENNPKSKKISKK